MFCRVRPLAMALAGLVACPTAGFAFGAIGCTELPDYDRAVGTIENGAYSCGMSMEEANRILAQHNGQAQAGRTSVARPAAPRHHRHRRHVPPPM